MCTYSCKDKLSVAKEDITCYKVVSYEKEKNKYYAYYRANPISNEVFDDKKPYVAIGDGAPEPSKFFGTKYGYKFGSGYIHTFSNKNDTDDYRFGGTRIFKCIIPKGTPYLKGIDSRERSTYISKQIIFVEMIAEH